MDDGLVELGRGRAKSSAPASGVASNTMLCVSPVRSLLMLGRPSVEASMLPDALLPSSAKLRKPVPSLALA